MQRPSQQLDICLLLRGEALSMAKLAHGFGDLVRYAEVLGNRHIDGMADISGIGNPSVLAMYLVYRRYLP